MGFLDQTPVTSRTPAPSQRELRADKFYFMSLIVTSQNIQRVLCDSFVLRVVIITTESRIMHEVFRAL